MAHISNAVEYALHCLLYLVNEGDQPLYLPVKDLAEMQGVSPQYLAKIFTKLSNAGLITAAEGTKGGFCLSKRAEDISVLAVIDAIDGNKPLFDCANIRERCAVLQPEVPAWAKQGLCSIHSVMLDAEEHMRASLKQHSLATIQQALTKKAPKTYGEHVLRWFDQKETNRHQKRTETKTPRG